ncbi:TPA_asm: capsid protein precursor [Neosmilaster georgianus associated picornavirus 5]|nr:TPA_asm: capsid protein precursor [Neosmilaster georgianus associated picornavirus 5]
MSLNIHIIATHTFTYTLFQFCPVLDSQSGLGWSTGTSNSGEKVQTTSFESSALGTHFIAKEASDPLRTDGMTGDISLNGFLSRPQQLSTLSWAPNDFIRETFNPWQLYLESPAVRRKLSNYAWFHGTLRLKLVVNGTQFHYGKGLLSYMPLSSTIDPVRTPGSAPIIDNVKFSQRPHIVFDPSASEGGDLTLPFVLDSNWLDLLSRDEMISMGECTLSSFNMLQHANGGGDAVTITIFGWMEDVKLSGSTTQLSVQSGFADEYGDGAISKPASAVARFASKLSSVPYIGPYATATAMGAGTVGRIASLFGYCRPNNLEPVRKYRPTVLGNMANTTIEEAVDKLTFDPKQELTIDPSVTGYAAPDELCISDMAQRETYITKFDWDVLKPQGTLLASFEVTPSMWQNETIGFKPEISMTPMAYVSQPFEYWRGSIEYRLQIACSKFHKGRLRVVYDPKSIDAGVPDWMGGFSRVLDISEDTTFSIKVGWNQNKTFHRIEKIFQTVPPLTYSPADGSTTVLNQTPTPGFGNGVLNIYVLNELTSPSASGDDIQINVFVKACDDFEVADPTDSSFKNLSFFPPQTAGSFDLQSGELSSDAVSDNLPSGHEGGETDVAEIGTTQDYPITSLVHFGEVFHSFRTMMKRYNYSTTEVSSIPTSEATWLWTMTRADFPQYRGFDPRGSDTQLSNSYTYSRMTLINYLTPAFVARRGGIRWKYAITYANYNNDLSSMYLPFTIGRTRFDFAQISNTLKRVGDLYNGNWKGSNVDERLDTWSGSYTTNLSNNPTIEAELPYYSNLRFERSRIIDRSEIAIHSHQTQAAFPSSGNSGALSYDAYVATGEDFNLTWFLNVPTVYYVLDNPSIP